MEQPRIRSVGDDGITLVRAGQSTTTGFVESVIAAYTNLTNQPAALILLVLLGYMFVAELHNNDGPLEHIQTQLNSLAPAVGWEKTTVTVLAKILSFVIKHKIVVIKLGFLWFTAAVRPSRNNIIVCAMFTLVSFIYRTWNTIDFVLLSQAHFLFSSVRKPFYKLLILAIAVAFLFAGYELSLTPPETPSTGGGTAGSGTPGTDSLKPAFTPTTPKVTTPVNPKVTTSTTPKIETSSELDDDPGVYSYVMRGTTGKV